MFRILLMTVAVVALGTGAAFAGSFTDDQKKEIGEVVRSYLMENPSIIYEAAEKHQQALKDAAQEQAKKVLIEKKAEIFDNPAYAFLGDPKAKITFAEFFDYNCGYCKHAYPDLVKMVADHPNIRVVLIDTPILGESSDLAARYAVAAKGFGKYVDYHGAIMRYNGPKNEENLLSLAKGVGLDPAKLKEAAAKPETQAQIDKNMELFRALGLNGTPAFAAPDRLIPEFMGPDSLVQIATEAEGKAK